MSRARTLLLTGLGALTLGLAACGEEQSERDAARDPLGPASTTGRTSDETGTSPGDKTTAEASDGLKRGEVKTYASGIEVPWDIAFLPDGDPIVSERDRGQIVTLPLDGGKPSTIDVDGVSATGEGGLLGLAVSPDYEQDRTVFAYLTSSSDNRIVAINMRTKKQRSILTGLKKNSFHNGGALEFGPDGKLYAGVGDAGDTNTSQDRASRNGKVLRIDPDGGVPADNPIDGSPIWSLGHRNVQGLTWDGDGRLWASEFGQNDVDEVNLIQRGKNYGWPEVEGAGDTQGGKYTSPVVTWSPTSSSSPSGAAIVGDELYVSALAGRTLWQIALDGTTAKEPKSLFPDKYGRIRAVVAGPDGTLWFSTSNTDGRGDPANDDDKILRLGV